MIETLCYAGIVRAVASENEGITETSRKQICKRGVVRVLCFVG